MPRYKHRSLAQLELLPVSLRDQIQPGTFEHALDELVEQHLDLSAFDARFENDLTGAPAYNPRLMLKIVLFAYSRGLIHSREIARACREHVVFMALAQRFTPHFTTIAEFVALAKDDIAPVFSQVLMICNEAGLIGGSHFAIDGLKLPSNASKLMSGHRADFQKRLRKCRIVADELLARHQQADAEEDESVRTRIHRSRERVQQQIEKLSAWLRDHEDKPGSRKSRQKRRVRKQNVTDPDSALMMTSHGVVQGFAALAAVDREHQIIVHAEVTGESEQSAFKAVMAGLEKELTALDTASIEGKVVLCDAGFFTEDNVQHCYERGIDAYIADPGARARDPRFQDASRHQPTRDARTGRALTRDETIFRPDQFIHDGITCTCPAGHRLTGPQYIVKDGYHGKKYVGRQSICGPCPLRAQCLRHANQVTPRQVMFFSTDPARKPETFCRKMRRKIDSTEGRRHYNQRIGIVEPVFGNLRVNKGLDRFTLRGKEKVNGQWLLYCLVHNIEKWQKRKPPPNDI